MSPVGVSKVASGGLAVSQAPAGYGLPCLLAQGQAITVVPSGGLPIADAGTGIFAPPFVAAVWDLASSVNVTLSGGNLVATNTTGASNNCGARLTAASFRSSGKYYFEATVTTVTSGSQNGVGIALSTVLYSDMSAVSTGFDKTDFPSGTLWQNGSPTGIVLGAFTTGNICGMAIDLDNRKMWFRKAPAGLWNASGTDNPATSSGGIAIPAGSLSPICNFGGSGSAANNVTTANFGATAFSGAVPSGFTSGWPA